MENTLYNPLCYNNDTTVRNAQIVYLHEVVGMTYENISKIVKLAVSTCSNYYHKFKVALGTMARKIFKIGATKRIDIITECELKKGDCAYIVEFFNADGDFTYTKIGYSNDVFRRMKEHIDRTKYGTSKIVIKAVFYFDDEEQALTMENAIRKYYKDKNSKADFVKRDRFSVQRLQNAELTLFTEKAEKIKEIM